MTHFQLEHWLNKDIEEARPLRLSYKEQPKDYVQLALMENPFSWPKALHQQWLHEIGQVAINRYPSLHQSELKAEFRDFYQLSDSHDVLFGNGSNELIQTLLRAFSGANHRILVPSPSYFVYERLAQQMSYEVISVDLKPNFEMNLPAMLDALEKQDPVLTFISYPNNPTAHCFHEADIEKIIQKSRGIVIIDEAYFPYSEKTFLDKIEKYTNVLVLRSLSKVGLASIRLGYLIGPKKIITYLEKLQLPFSINSLSLVTAHFILRHFDLLSEQVEHVLAQRRWLKVKMEHAGITVYPSDSNYLVFRIEGYASKDIRQHCLENKIVITDLNQVHYLFKNCCRVAIGTPENNQVFLNRVLSFMKSKDLVQVDDVNAV